MMAGILTRDSALLIPSWLGPYSQVLFLRKVALLVNRYYYGFKIIMSINKTTPSPLALREGFHVVLLRALDPAQREQLQDEDTWIARQLFVGDLIDQILAVPPETIT
jgi:hypothetical protein